MNYNTESVRRQDRLLNEQAAIELLSGGEYGVLSLQAEAGGGYGIPINYVWDGKQSVYVHCAPDGEKLRCVAVNNQVSFCVVGKTEVISEKFTTNYESIVLKCVAVQVVDDEERVRAMELLVEKYSPDFKAKGHSYIFKSISHTVIIRLEVREWSGKTKCLTN